MMKLLSARYRIFWRIQFCIIFAILVLSSAAGANSVWIESGPGGWYNRTYANFTYNSNSTGDIYYVTVGSYSSFLADKYYNATGLIEKNYTFSVKAYNGTAWVGPVQRSFWIDLIPPTVNITQAPGAWLNFSTASFVWQGSDSRSGIAGYYYWLDSALPVYTNNTNITLVNIGNGSHVFNVKVIDKAGNVGSAASYDFGINTDLPVVSITSGPGGWTNIAAPTFTWTGTAYNSTLFGYYYRWDSVPQNTTAGTSITLPPLPDGAHTFYIQAVDADMRVGDIVSRSFSIDTVKPNTAITSGPNGWINTSSFTFSWNGSDNVNGSGISGYYYWLNNESRTFTTSTNVILSSPDGSYVFHIEPVDSAGNIGAVVNRSFGIDTGVVSVEIVYGPSGWINQRNATFDWVSSSASGISGHYYWMDNGSKTFTVNTSVTINSLSEGSHTFSVQAYNLLNVSSNIAVRSFSVDTMPPSAPVVSESHSGGNATPWPEWSSHNTPYFTWPASTDNGSGVASYRARKNGEAWIEVTSGYHPVLGTGQYIFEFWAVDNVGNAGNKTTIYLKIDNTPPTTWFTSAASWFNTTSPTFAWNGSDAHSGIAGYYYALDNSTEIFTASTNLVLENISTGSHILYLKPIDHAGNNGLRISRNFGADVISPTVNITSNQNGWLNSGTQTFTWAGTDDFSGIKGYYYWIDNGTRIYTEIASATVFMGDGAHTFHVQALDNAGNTGSEDFISFRIKTTPPPAPVVNETHSNGSSFPNPAWSSHDTPYFQWNTSNDALEYIEYYQASIDSGAWFNITTPYHPAIGTGSHFFDFRAVDIVGLASYITRTYVRIDTVPPVVSLTSGPSGWTNNSAPGFAWNGTDAHSGIAGYYYSIDNGTETFTALPNATLTSLSDGEHTISLRAVDNVGLLSANVSRTFSVDTIPPSAPVVNETHSNGSSTPNPSWSSHDTPLFDWIESTDIGSGIGYYEARLNNGFWLRLTAKLWHPPLPSGVHTMDFRAVDNVSNAGNFTIIYLRIDTVAPIINNLSGPSGWTNNTSPTFTWNASDNESGIAGYYYSYDNSSEIFTINTGITLTAAAGNHTFSLRAIDNVNLSSSPVMREFWIDTSLPNVTITTGPSGWTKITAPAFTWNGSDNLSGIKGYYYSIDNTPWVYTSSTYTTLPAQGDGNHSFYVRAVDNAGNIGNNDSREFIIDTVPPVLNITGGPSGWTNNSSPVFAWNASDNSSGIAGYYFSTDSGPEIFTMLPNTTLANLSEGAHIFSIKAVDNAGVNTTASRSFSVDVSPPTVNITYNPGAETNNKTPLFIWGGADSLSGLKGYYYSYDNSSEIFTLATNITLPSFPDGNHIFRVRAVDMVWLSSVYDTWSFTLNTVPPTIPVVTESHAGGSAPNPPWSTHNTPYFTWPDSIDDIGSPVRYELSINNGTWTNMTSPHHPVMATGSYEFRFRAVDSVGNPSDAYPVYVRIDTVPPSVVITSAPNGWTNETALFFAWNGTDIGSGVAGYYYHFDGGADTYTASSTLSVPALPDGAHTFNIRAVDNVGFESAAASRNFFTDTNAPSVWLEEMPGMWTNNSTPFFAWDSTDGAGSGVAGYRYRVDAAPEVYTVNNSIELPYLPDGAHIFNIVAVDRVGWESPVLQYTFNIDTEGPGLFVVNESHSNGSPFPNPSWSTHNTPNFNWSAPTDIGSGLSRYEASVNNGTWQTVSSPWHLSISSGNYTFRFRGVDSVGNPGLIYTLYVRIDIDNPVISSISGPSGWISTNAAALNPYNQNITWNALDNESGIAGYYYKFDSGVEVYTTLARTSLPSLPDGAHTFSVRVVDNVG
ncbi:MAG: Ig-like domain repeat protein, partial [Candidatus Methanoperedens sp.]